MNEFDTKIQNRSVERKKNRDRERKERREKRKRERKKERIWFLRTEICLIQIRIMFVLMVE
jgi:hypothetical protein